MNSVIITRPQRRAKSSRGKLGRGLIALLLLLAGVVLLLYPVVATQYNNTQQRAFAEKYNTEVQQAAPNELAADLEAARNYNKTLAGVPILDPYLQRVGADPGSKEYRTYESMLSRLDAMARIRVPSVSIDLPVRHGTSDPVLAEGAGHLYGTSLPVGGVDTHAVLTSHTGLTSATLFDHLINVKEGDLMYVDVLGQTLAYKVDQIKVVLPSQINDLSVVPGHDYLTLFTCTPYAVNSHRLLVRGERVPDVAGTTQAGTSRPALQMESWMWLLIGGAVVGLSAGIAIVARERRRRKAAGRPERLASAEDVDQEIFPD